MLDLEAFTWTNCWLPRLVLCLRVASYWAAEEKYRLRKAGLEAPEGEARP